MKQWKYFPLIKPTMVSRRHQKDVSLPAVIEATNLYVSKSDHSFTLRPDLDNTEAEWEIPSIADLYWKTTGMTSPDTGDFLNAVHGIWGTDDLCLFTRFAPFIEEGTALWSTYTVGTARVDGTHLSSTRSKVLGEDTEWLQNVWPGCFIYFAPSDFTAAEWWRVDEVESNTVLYVDGQVTQATYDDYIIYRTYNSEWTRYKLHVDPYTSGLIVASPTITVPFQARNICGPFYIGLSEGKGEFKDWTIVDTGLDYENAVGPIGRQIAADNTRTGASGRFVSVRGAGSGVPTATYPRVVYSSDPENTWAASTVQGNIQGSPVGTVFSTGDTYFHLLLAEVASGARYNLHHLRSVDGAYWKLDTTIDSSTLCNGAGGLAYGQVGALSGNMYIMLALGRYGFYQRADGDSWSSFIEWPTGGSTFDPKDAAAGKALSTSTSSFFYIVGNPNGGTETCFMINDATPDAPSVITVSDAAKLTGVATNGDGYWVFVGEDGSGNPSAWYRADGVTYTKSESGMPFTPERLIWSGKYFVGGSGTISPGKICYSTDGKEWSVWTDAEWGRVYDVYADEEMILANFDIDVSSDFNYDFLYGDWEEAEDESWRLGELVPLSDTIRAACFAVLHGQVVLFGTYEYNDSTDTWEHHPRRIRWTSPGTYNDFTSAGSGTADAMGSGVFLDARAVNGRILVFESNQISALSKRGTVADPFEYDVLARGTGLLSNPLIVDEVCYWIDGGTGLLAASDGISIEIPIDAMPFDLTQYSDNYDNTKPASLSYYSAIRSLACYQYDSSATHHYTYVINLDSGSVARWELPRINDAGAWHKPQAAIGIEDSSDNRMLVSWNAYSTRTRITVAEVSEGEIITGKDAATSVTANDERFYGVIETGEIWLAPEGQKVILQDVVLKTHLNEDCATPPSIVVEVQSTEDDFSTWYGTGDSEGTIALTASACSGTSTIFSNNWGQILLGVAAETVTTTPWLATGCRIYAYDGASEYTLLTKTVTGTNTATVDASGNDALGNPLAGQAVYVYYDGYPEVFPVAVNDFIKTTADDSGATLTRMHRIDTVTDKGTLILDFYMPSGDTSDTAVHRVGNAIPTDKSGEVTCGINRLVQGVKLRIYLLPDENGDVITAKITGITLGYTPAGDKKVE